MATGDALSKRLAASLAAFRTGRDGAIDDEAGAASDRAHEYEERAAILEYDQGLPRHEAERIARAARDDPPG